MPSIRTLATFVWFYVAVHCPAQELLWTALGQPNRSTLGTRLSVIGDVDHDGYEDLVTQGGFRMPNGVDQLSFLSGRDGRLLRIYAAPTWEGGFLGLFPAGDMDADGTRDYVVTFGDNVNLNRRVQVRSGLDDRLIWEVVYSMDSAFGLGAAGDLDLDGDSRPDLVVTDERAFSGRGGVFAYSNQRQLLYTRAGTAELNFSRAIAKVGDVDGDRCDDFVVGSFGSGPEFRGQAALVSGRTGTVIRAGVGELPYDILGYSVTGCGDIDQDGVPDFASGNSDFGSLRGVVRVFSGRTAEPIYTWTGGPSAPGGGNAFGVAIAGGVDVDRDGIPDVLVGAPGEWVGPGTATVGAAYLFSGRDGSVLARHVFDGQRASATQFGLYLAMIARQPGSPFGLYLIAEPGYPSGEPPWPGGGRIYCRRGAVPTVESFGVPCRGTLSTFPKIGLRSLGPSGTRVHLSGAEPGRQALLAIGFSRSSWPGGPLPTPLFPYGYPGCLALVSGEILRSATVGTTGAARGYAYVDLPLPVAVPPGTLPVYGQWFCSGSGTTAPGGVSDALRWYH